MTCDSARELIHPLLDQELEPAQKSDVEAHLRSCVGCAEVHHEMLELRKRIQDRAPYYTAPAHLAARVKAGLRESARSEQGNRWRWAWVSIPASLAFAAAALWAVVVLRSNGPSEDLLAQEMVASHVRSLMPGHLLDVPTSDQHTVKPWFNGKLDFSPQVKDLTDEGFTLIGGRLDYLVQRPVAALVYERRKHIINLFVWPQEAGGATNPARSGFNIVHWASGGLGYWAISDLNEAELRDFARTYEK
jgi:anti-sigma factor RsiW